MKKPLIFIANWKMCLTPTQAVSLTHKIIPSLNTHIQNPGCRIVLCPSFSSLLPIAHQLEKTRLALGAQNCSSAEPGALTGEESAKTLSEIGCRFCIIGHSEQRVLNSESSEQVAEKMIRLFSYNITPVVCIGENAEEFTAQKTKERLHKQLDPLFTHLKKASLSSPQSIIIAYEPIWAIGTGRMPDKTFLVEIFKYLDTICTEAISNKHLEWQFLYGGSVKSANAHELASISHLSGFLIGGASLDSQEFEKIVDYSYL